MAIDTTDDFPVAPVGTPELADDFVISWGASPWTGLRARDGVRIHFKMKVRPVFSDANAVVDWTLESLGVEARFIPVSAPGPDEGAVMGALEVQGALPGRSVADGGEMLVVAGGDWTVLVPRAELVSGELAFEAVKGRVGGVGVSGFAGVCRERSGGAAEDGGGKLARRRRGRVMGGPSAALRMTRH